MGAHVAPQARGLNLPLLAESAFAQVRAAISGMHADRWLRDEVDVLNTTAVTLSSQLETLHGEIAKKSQDLSERVNELGQERDFVTKCWIRPKSSS